MLTSSGYGAISPIAPRKVYRTAAGRENRALAAPGGSNYDSFTLSAPSQDGQFLNMVSRLSREVRTATTTGPISIAARMLFLGEGR